MIQLLWNEGESVVKFWESSANNRIGVQVRNRRRRGQSVVETTNAAATFISRKNAKRLRDWLNKFLEGE